MSPSRRVLIIDDEPAVLESLVEFLELCGHTVFSAGDGAQGLSLFASVHPDLVLTDMQMPGMDGLAVISAVKALNPQTPVIGLSGHEDSTDQARRSGASATITKPIWDLETLCEMIESVMSR